MEKESFVGLLLFLCCFLNISLTGARVYQGRLCQEKAAIFDELTRRLTRVLTDKDRGNHLICQKLSGYISHALYTRQTCPNLPLVQNSTFLNTVALMKSDFDERCDANKYIIVANPCSPAMVQYLVENCNRFVDQVQFWMPRLEVCDISKNFISCHEESLDECQDSDLFGKYHIHQALQVTRDSLDFLCDASLANVPWENGPDHRRSIRSLGSATDPDCPIEIKLGRSVTDVCTEEKEWRFPGVSLGSAFGDICSVFDFMYICTTDMFEKCANSTPENDKSYFLDNFQVVYNAYGCDMKSEK
ncbi:hypothetical protein ElyMa_004216200 [Elysia marginata]|uniref:DUF19 domain-containing protein n=1 Tax=Elysia marginata TaxID=1093978 RepID=A0AAV4GQB9_9GAST|nr:hypothetical protein ElyMa_004216200 [Elysia marginata]